MGLFDGQAIKFAEKLSTRLHDRANYFEDLLVGKNHDPGTSLTFKIATFIFRELAVIIHDSVKD